MNILDKIVADKRNEVARRKSLFPVTLLEQSIYFRAEPVSLKEYILREDKVGIIAEFKRKSPSKGYINEFANVEEVSIGYMQAGASALSVLTDEKYFAGKSEDLTIARNFNFCPILRKDFIVDPYQVIEARSIGADAILLIAEVLTKVEIKELAELAHKLGMQVLTELHHENQLEKLNDSIDLVGVNNRDLSTFKTSTATSERIVELIPNQFVKISESGISSAETIVHLKQMGYQGFLLGEIFMKATDPAWACRKLINQVNEILHQKVVS